MLVLGNESTAGKWTGADYQLMQAARWKLPCPNGINALIRLTIVVGDMVKHAGHKQRQMV